MSITGVRHVALTVSDLDRSAGWYADVLGFVELFRESHPDRRAAILRVPETGVLVGLVQFITAATISAAGRFAPQQVGLDHLCFALASRGDMDAWTLRLEEREVAHSGVLEMTTGPTLNFADPDGIALSFALPPPNDHQVPGGNAMDGRVINPWTWQERAGFVQAHEIGPGARTLYCAGVASVDSDGRPVHVGDMAGQLGQALDNLETLLHAAGYRVTDLVRLNTYTTDVDAYAAARSAVTGRLAGAHYTATLLGVAQLARPELLVELEATAAA